MKKTNVRRRSIYARSIRVRYINFNFQSSLSVDFPPLSGFTSVVVRESSFLSTMYTDDRRG